MTATLLVHLVQTEIFLLLNRLQSNLSNIPGPKATASLFTNLLTNCISVLILSAGLHHHSELAPYEGHVTCYNKWTENYFTCASLCIHLQLLNTTPTNTTEPLITDVKHSLWHTIPRPVLGFVLYDLQKNCKTNNCFCVYKHRGTITTSPRLQHEPSLSSQPVVLAAKQLQSVMLPPPWQTLSLYSFDQTSGHCGQATQSSYHLTVKLSSRRHFLCQL